MKLSGQGTTFPMQAETSVGGGALRRRSANDSPQWPTLDLVPLWQNQPRHLRPHRRTPSKMTSSVSRSRKWSCRISMDIMLDWLLSHWRALQFTRWDGQERNYRHELRNASSRVDEKIRWGKRWEPIREVGRTLTINSHRKIHSAIQIYRQHDSWFTRVDLH